MSATDFNRALLVNAEFLKPFAFTLTHDQEDAKDLFQETVCRAIVNQDKYNIGTNIKAWLYTIMRNVFINSYRKKSRHELIFDKESNDAFINSLKAVTVNSALSTINLKEIQKKVLSLPEIFKDPFVLYFDGFRYNEIADMLREPVGTIKSRIHFARKLLKSEIDRF